MNIIIDNQGLEVKALILKRIQKTKLVMMHNQEFFVFLHN